MIFPEYARGAQPIRKVGRPDRGSAVEHARPSRRGGREGDRDPRPGADSRGRVERYHADFFFCFFFFRSSCRAACASAWHAPRAGVPGRKLRIDEETTPGSDVTTQKTVRDLIGSSPARDGMRTIRITPIWLGRDLLRRIVVMERRATWSRARSARADSLHLRIPIPGKLMRATPRPGASLRDLLPETDGTLARDMPPVSAAAPSACTPLGGGEAESRKTAQRRGKNVRNVHGASRRRARTSGGGGISSRSIAARARAGRRIRCGKSTTNHGDAAQRHEPTGSSCSMGQDIGAIRPAVREAAAARAIQMVFQDRPTASTRASPRPVTSPDPLLRRADLRGAMPYGHAARARPPSSGMPIPLLNGFHSAVRCQKARVGIARAIALKSRSRPS